jgi:uncharacterized protein (TIRG00374 family)
MAAPAERSPRRQLIWNIFKTLLALSLIAYVLSKTDASQLAGLRGRISWPWFFADLILFLLLTVIKAAQYHALISQEAPYRRVLNIVILQNAISNFVAASAGIASYLTLMKAEEGVKLRKGATSFLVAKFGDLLAVGLFLGLTTALLDGQAPFLRKVAAFLLLCILLAAAVFLLTVLLRQRFIGMVRGLLERSRLLRLPAVQRGMDAMQFLADQKDSAILHTLRVGIAYSLLYMAVTLAWSYCNLRVFSMVQPLNTVGFVNALMQLISWIPIQVFGGLGVTETTLVYLFGQFGVPQADMAAVSIGQRLLFYVLSLLVLSYLPLSGLLARERMPA